MFIPVSKPQLHKEVSSTSKMTLFLQTAFQNSDSDFKLVKKKSLTQTYTSYIAYTNEKCNKLDFQKNNNVSSDGLMSILDNNDGE